MPAPRIDIDPSGFFNALRRFGRDLDHPTALYKEGGDIVIDVAREPRLTGRLAGSKRFEQHKDHASVAWTVPYARFAHWGTKYMSANPWAARAATAATPRFVSAIETGIETIRNRHDLN